MKRVVAIVQGRMGSSRLPGKSLRVLGGQPLIANVMRRAATIAGVDQVVLATTAQERDTPLVDTVFNLGFDVFRGSENLVLQRFMFTAIHFQADVIMRITGDCPFLAPDVAEEVLNAYLTTNPLGAEYFSNDTTQSGFPDGVDIEVFSFGLLERAYKRAQIAYDLEHVTSWMRKGATTGMIKAEQDWSGYKLSVDSPADYDYAIKVAAALPKDVSGRALYRLSTTLQAVSEVTHV